MKNIGCVLVGPNGELASRTLYKSERTAENAVDWQIHLCEWRMGMEEADWNLHFKDNPDQNVSVNGAPSGKNWRQIFDEAKNKQLEQKKFWENVLVEKVFIK